MISLVSTAVIQALPDLLHFWSEHGIGLVQNHSLLQWNGEALTALSSEPHPGTPSFPQ